jgi:hypothetical protein
MVPAALYLATMDILAWMLWRKRDYTLSQLRWCEGLLFGLTTLYFVGVGQ